MSVVAKKPNMIERGFSPAHPFMTNGPPPSSAGPSQIPPKSSVPSQVQPQNTSRNHYLPQYSQNQPQFHQYTSPQSSYYPSNTNPPPIQQNWQHQQSTWQVPLSTQPTHPQPQSYASGPQSYTQPNYQYTQGYPPGSAYSRYPVERQPVPQQQQQQQQQHSAPLPAQSQPKVASQNLPKATPKAKRPPPPSTPSPPPPQFHRHWDAVIATFLSSLGLIQALRGFENDMLVVNEEWERQKVPKAIGELMRDLMSLGQSPNIDRKERTLDERKLDYTHLAKGVEARSQTSINKSISTFLAQNRARNDASNRAEFLLSLAEKRARLNESTSNLDASMDPENPTMALEPTTLKIASSCARTDAKKLDRDVQMRYDITKNEEGPLRRTVGKAAATDATANGKMDTKGKGKGKQIDENGTDVTRERYPALDERLVNAETHLAVRYVPSPPRFLLDRLRFLEEHIIHLEKEYPPWAALHFNQPHRGWPPPPRPTPIIVPSHLTSTQVPTAATFNPATSLPSESAPVKTKNPKSSLHRAVMERLEVQKARSDLAGRGAESNG